MNDEGFSPKRFKGKLAGVLGLGRSGAAAARLLAGKGFKVLGSDSRPLPDLRKALGRLPPKVKLEGGGHSKALLKCGFIVKSPGLPPSLPILKKLEGAGVPVFSELEVALAFCRTSDIVAVTGTNGKSTTTALVGEMLKRDAKGSRRKVVICGNIGLPVSQEAPKAGPKDVLVVEVSSYQLEDSRRFSPRAAAVLNITPDHLDHHGSMEAYIAAKGRVFAGQGPGDVCVFNAADPGVVRLSRSCPSRRLFFGVPERSQAWAEKGGLRVRLPGKKDLKLPRPRLPGPHNLENALAASLLALARGARASAVASALKGFPGLEHRLEESGTARGIRCVNDSKATNVDSTLVALRAFEDEPGRVLLILGGLHKGSPYTPLKAGIEKCVKGILTIGSAAPRIEHDLAGTKTVFPCGDLETAVRTALQVGAKGDILLLSPACASFDQFKDFEDRGRRFKALVRELA